MRDPMLTPRNPRSYIAVRVTYTGDVPPMGAIIIEGVLFVALVATGVALVSWVILAFTPAGVRLRQARNRRRIERSSALTCPIHGPQSQDRLVLLANGERVCPDCYQETFT